MITRTEVTRALILSESVCHGNPLGTAPVTINQGTLCVLIEAAKCARYFNNGHNWGAAMSESEMILDYSEQKVTDTEELDAGEHIPTNDDCP